MKEKYKKENLEPIIKKCKNWSEVLIQLGMSVHGGSRITLNKYRILHSIDISHFETAKERYSRTNKILGKINKISINKILVENSTYSSTTDLKHRLYDEGFKVPICELCGQDEFWYGNKISLILDHINGVNNDHRIENLRIVCPNCNAALPTHCRGHKYLKKQSEKKVVARKKRVEYYKKRRLVDRPSYEQLKKEIVEYGYSATGRKYDVSDNAIRKWVKFYEKYE